MACDCWFRKRLRRARVRYIPKKTVYLDYNATTPVDPGTLGAFDRMCRTDWGNPSSLHCAGLGAWDAIEKCRGKLADYFGCTASGLHFCSSASEAIHAGLAGTARREVDRVLITTAAEHAAVLHPVRILALGGRDVIRLGIDQNGILDLEGLKRAVTRNRKTFLVLSPVNHETGAVQPLKEIASITAGADCTVMLDGVQSAARMEPRDWVPLCDMFCISGHKVYAPKGTAFLWKKDGKRLGSFRFGGRQEGRLFPGTQNTAGIAALTTAVEILKRERDQNDELSGLKTLSLESLEILKSAGLKFILESPQNRAPGILCLSLPWARDMAKLLYFLNSNQICLSRFSACSEKVTGPSKILLLMGRSVSRASSSIRISLGRWSRRDDFYRLATVLREACQRGI